MNEVISEEKYQYRCQFCGERSPVSEWKDSGETCPCCGAKYDWMLAQDTEDE